MDDTSDIQVLSSVEAVRKRPGMYIGDVTDGSGLRHMFLEVFSNAVDAVFGMPDGRIDVLSVFPEVIIRDNGSGIPFDTPHPTLPDINERSIAIARAYFETLHYGSTLTGHAPHFHMGHLFGVGLPVVNALSETFSVKSWYKGKLWYCEYEKGVCVKVPVIKETGTGVGTEISFCPDPEIFETINNSREFWEEDVRNAAYLCPKISYSYLEEEYYSESGLSDLISDLSPRFSMRQSVSDFYVDLAIGGKAEAVEWMSWVNGTKTPQHGSHVTAVKQALKNMDLSPSKVLIHVIGKTPKFAGPTRGEFCAPDLVEPLVIEILNKFQQEKLS